ncbi:MAG: hypothetical protein K9N21_04715 [Deltaproteobacteria bacterium]|nr:hypothetical protein [Deltaproteobacteria bacterium]
MKKLTFLGMAMALWCLGYGTAAALDPDDMARLTKAGLGGNVIQTIIDEKVIETCAFTVDEIIDLKKSGMRDEAIEGIVKKGSFMKGPQKVVYGKTTQTLKSISPEDMIKLKEAGISDDVLKEIARGNIDRDDMEHRRAWDMLDSMGLLVDGRRDYPVPRQ